MVICLKSTIKIPATPFAGTPYIQNYRYLKKENENKKEESINKIKDKK